MLRTGTIGLLAALLCVGALGLNNSSWAQDRERPQRGEFDREEFQRRMEERRAERQKELMTRLDIEGEDEQKFITEMIEDVQTKQREVSTYSSRGFGFGGRGGRGGRGGDAQAREGAEERELPEGMKHMQKLRELAEDDSASQEQIKKALDAYRAARTKAEKELEESRNALREVLDAKQQLVLVTTGVLD